MPESGNDLFDEVLQDFIREITELASVRRTTYATEGEEGNRFENFDAVSRWFDITRYEYLSGLVAKQTDRVIRKWLRHDVKFGTPVPVAAIADIFVYLLLAVAMAKEEGLYFPEDFEQTGHLHKKKGKVR